MWRPLVIALLLAGCGQSQPASATGAVVDQNGKPLAGVHLRLITGDFNSNDGVEAVYGATSDSAGQFSLEGLKAGLYIVIAERTGYIQQSSSPLPFLALKPGQQLTGHKIVMAARALIAGRVVDEFGDAVQGVDVHAEPVAPNQSQSFLFGRNATSDDRGEFRLFASPGKYYLRALQSNSRTGPSEIRTDGTPGGAFITTYYPSAAGKDAASVVEVAAGQDVAGMDIRLLRASPGSPAHTFTISGVVLGTPENGRANVMLRFGESAGQLRGSRFSSAGEDGKFSVTGMQPGFYSAVAFYASGKTMLASHPVSFHLDTADETGLQLTLAPGEDLTGKLELLGDAPAGPPEKRTVRLESADLSNAFGQTEPAAVEVGPDGSFHMANLLPGKFRPVVEPMPENGYVKEVALDGKAIPDRVLDFSQGVGGSRLKITVSRAGARISGRLLGKDGEPAMGMMMIFFGTDVKHIDESDAARASDGKYSFKAVRPGKYRIFAIDVAELMKAFTGDGNNDEWMQTLFDAAEEIEIKDGDRITKDIPVLTELPQKKEANAPR
jgi:hypothetical protein